MNKTDLDIFTPLKEFSGSAITNQAKEAFHYVQQNGNGRNLPIPIVISLELDEVDILSWLRSSNQNPKMYWCSRDNGFEIGGVGSIFTVATQDPSLIPEKLAFIEKILQSTPENTNIGFIGGAHFDLTLGENSSWPNFPTFRYVLPEVFIHRQQDTYTISISLLIENGISFEELNLTMLSKFKSLKFINGEEIGSEFPQVISKINYPEWPEWKNNIEVSLRKIQDQELEKVVLARRTDLQFSFPIDWVNVIRSFKKQNKNCFVYCFQPRKDVTFLGATPERLFKIKSRTLFSEAVSGTISRSSNIVEDEESANYLLNSEKNLREHEFVVDGIKKIKNRLCDNIYAQTSPSLLKLTNVFHLYTRISGKLREGISIYDVLSTLHPTPAVGGTPQLDALELIHKLEPFERGWYAAPIGIISREWSEMVVALRSVLLDGDCAQIFAGAGIVQGSQPQAEWNELESKISIALEILNGK